MFYIYLIHLCIDLNNRPNINLGWWQFRLNSHFLLSHTDLTIFSSGLLPLEVFATTSWHCKTPIIGESPPVPNHANRCVCGCHHSLTLACRGFKIYQCVNVCSIQNIILSIFHSQQDQSAISQGSPFCHDTKHSHSYRIAMSWNVFSNKDETVAREVPPTSFQWFV